MSNTNAVVSAGVRVSRPTWSPTVDKSRERRLEKLLQLADTTGSGLIDFHEFVALDVLLSRPDAAVEVAFRLLDTDRSGMISEAELDRMWSVIVPGEAVPGETRALFAKGREVCLEEFKAEVSGQRLELGAPE